MSWCVQENCEVIEGRLRTWDLCLCSPYKGKQIPTTQKWLSLALGKHKHDFLPSCWLFWLNGRWYRSTKPKPKAKQVVEYSEISKETSELREGGRSDSSIHSKREKTKKKKKQLSCQNFRLVYKFSKHICRLVYRAGNICNHFFTRDFLQVKITQNTKTQNKQVSYKRKIKTISRSIFLQWDDPRHKTIKMSLSSVTKRKRQMLYKYICSECAWSTRSSLLQRQKQKTNTKTKEKERHYIANKFKY